MRSKNVLGSRLTNDLLLEIKFQLKSRWTIALFVACTVIAIGNALLSYSFITTMAPILEVHQANQGPEFGTWLVNSGEAENFRNEIYAANPANAVNSILMIFASIGPLIFIIWGASVIGNEFARRTARNKAAHMGWLRTVVIKLITVILMTFFSVGMTVLLGLLSGKAGWEILKSKYAWIDVPYGGETIHISVAFLTVVLGVAFYGILAFFVALLFKNFPIGIIVGFAIPYVEAAVQKWWLPQTAFGHLLNEILHYDEASIIGAPQITSIPPFLWISPLIILAWMMLLLILCNVIPRNQEIA